MKLASLFVVSAVAHKGLNKFDEHPCKDLWQRVYLKYCWKEPENCLRIPNKKMLRRQFEKAVNRFCDAYQESGNLYGGYQFFHSVDESNCRSYKSYEHCEGQKVIEKNFFRELFTNESYNECSKFVTSQCHRELNFCENHDCENDSRCVNTCGGYSCFCKPGFEGRYCENQVLSDGPNPCARDPCQNGSACEWYGDNFGFECICSDGYEGEFCENESVRVHPCGLTGEDKVCKNDGICVEDGIGYDCECISPWEGRNCKNSNPCNENPCENDGVCSSENGEFSCSCVGFWTGDTCEESTYDPCTSNGNPCQNGAFCIHADTRDGYRCECLPSWEGRNVQSWSINFDFRLFELRLLNFIQLLRPTFHSVLKFSYRVQFRISDF